MLDAAIAVLLAADQALAQRTESAPLLTLQGYTAGHLVADGRQRITLAWYF